MGSVLSKTNEDNTNRVTTINVNCFNREPHSPQSKLLPVNKNKDKKASEKEFEKAVEKASEKLHKSPFKRN